jgi:YVTN family beta-propeller protein
VTFTPDGKTAFVTDNGSGTLPGGAGSGTVSTIDVKTRTKDPTDIPVGVYPAGVAVTPDGKTAFVAEGGSVSTIDVKTRTKDPTDIPVGAGGTAQFGVAVTPDGKTAFVTDLGVDITRRQVVSGTVSTIDVTTRTKNPTDIAVGTQPTLVAVTPDGKTAVVTNALSDSVSTIDVKTGTKNPTDIPVGAMPAGLAITPCRR